jgi:hypothetical protein
LQEPLAEIVVVLGLASIEILHPLRMVFASHGSKDQMVEDLQVVEKGHRRIRIFVFVARGYPRKNQEPILRPLVDLKSSMPLGHRIS